MRKWSNYNSLRVGGNVNGITTLEGNLAVSSKTNHSSTTYMPLILYDSAIPLLRFLPMRNESVCLPEDCTRMLLVVLFIIAPKVQILHMPFNKRMNTKTVIWI